MLFLARKSKEWVLLFVVFFFSLFLDLKDLMLVQIPQIISMNITRHLRILNLTMKSLNRRVPCLSGSVDI